MNCVFSALPGSDMGLGKHLVIYQAADEAKNKEKCVFTITVVLFKQEHPGRKYVWFSNLIAEKTCLVCSSVYPSRQYLFLQVGVV